MDPRLRGLLACPRCAGELAEEAGGLRCASCHTWYPVRDGVPWLVEEFARPEPEGAG